MSAPLPPGWSQHTDQYGRMYFANSANGSTQWHHPTVAPNAPPPMPPAAQPTPPQGYPQPTPPQGYPQQGHAQQPAAPARAPTGQNPFKAQFCYQQRTEFKVKEKMFSLSGDGFSIKEVQSGQSYFKVKGNALALISEKKTLLDANGNPVYTLKEAPISLRGRMHIADASSKQDVITLRKKGFIPGLGTSTVQCWMGSQDDGDPYMEVKGNILRKSFNVTEVASGRTICSVKRKTTVQSLLLENDSYVVSVEPGVDAALMVVLAVALDESYRDDGNSSGLSSFL